MRLIDRIALNKVLQTICNLIIKIVDMFLKSQKPPDENKPPVEKKRPIKKIVDKLFKKENQ